MQAADKPVPGVKSEKKSDVTVWTGAKQEPASRNLDVVLKPLSRPELGDIHVDAVVFPIGRTEHPFDSYGNDVLNMLSRRHASIYRKDGSVYLVDLQSRNGTTVNRIGIGYEPCQLRDGDEISFGGCLTYRIQITARVRPEGSLTVMLKPESGDSGLETIVVSKFPFLVSKTDGVFAHYKEEEAHEAELRYLSRRHAHIYQKADQVYIGDLGSANGTFLDGQRLEDQAVPLKEGVVIAFGGKHFVYKVGIVRETGIDPADNETRQYLTERRLPMQPRIPTAQGTPPIANKVLPEGKAQAEVKPPVASQPAVAASPKPDSQAPAAVSPVVESKPRWGIFGRKSRPESPAPASPAAATKADGNARPAVGLNSSVQPAGNPPAPVGAKADNKPALAPSAQAGNKPGLAAAANIDSKQAPAAPAQVINKPAQAVAAKAEGKPVPAAPAKAENKATLGSKPDSKPADANDKKPPSTANAKADPRPEANSASKPQTPQSPATAQPVNDLNALAMDSGTQFMAAPTTFLTVLCAADGPKAAAPEDVAAAEAAAKEANVKRRPRGRVMLLLSELATLLKGEPDGTQPGRWKFAVIAVATVAALITTLYVWNASERAFKDAIAHNDYARAATLAGRLLDKHPDDMELKAKATEVGLKAIVPSWLQKIQSRDFDAAKSVLAGTADLSKRDTDLRPLTDELAWLGDLERLISVRGGPEAPIRIYADEDNIEHIISRWNEDTGEHQRALARIASYVPQFGDWYGEALTHLRRLQSESTVYLPVVERVKANIATELARDNPDVLKPALKDTAAEYPRLGGMDVVRQDLSSYIEIRHEARSRKTGRLFALLEKAHFATPPFQQSFHALVESGQLPPADLLHQYDAATRSWKENDPTDALAELQALTTGSWGDYLSRELDRRRAVATGFAALQQSRTAPDYVDRLLAFRESLDGDEDIYFIHATAADLSQQKDKVIERAQEAMNQARTYWQEYRNTGAIDASQRIETSVSDEFRTRAHSLAEASKYVQQAFRLYSQVDTAGATQWTAIRDEIQTEVDEQRGRLRDLSNVVEPALLNTKLALLGDANE